ncbi:unannotated protein [freshwater metagenome]|uniref:Unannotated protein n=1 Tax=freshwater metagenome TaxID=449393 RepID=A0A6J7RB37_9ZZZZ
MLQPLVLEPALDEHGIGIDIAVVDLDTRGVPPIHEHLVEGRAPAAERIEHGELAFEHRAGKVGGEGRDVEEQLGELLIRLARVALDGDEIVVEPVE